MRITRALLLSLSLLSPACDGGGVQPVGGRAVVVLRPQLSTLANVTSQPIHRIRVSARDVTTSQTLNDTIVTVDPAAAEWFVAFNVDLRTATAQVEITMQLIHVTSGGVESIEWSGRSTPIALAPGGATVHDVMVHRGPIDNLAVEAVRISDSPDTIREGGTAQLRSSVQAPNSVNAEVFWASATNSIATVNATGLVTAVAPGTALIIALAGARADTARINVVARPARIVLSTARLDLTHIGAEGAITARVEDTRGAVMANEVVEWVVPAQEAIEHLGGGRFRSRGTGTVNVSVRVVTPPSVQANASIVVVQTPARVVISPATATLDARDQNMRFSAAVQDAGGAAVTGTTIVWSSSNPSVAAITGDGTATALANGTTTITAAVGAPGGTPAATAVVTVARVARQLESVTGNGQTARVGSAVTIAPAVRATDANGHGLAGVTVTFEAAAASGGVSETSVVTDASGVARVGAWTLGPSAGTQTLVARVSGLAPITFSATATPGPAARIAIVDGAAQSTTAGTAVPVRPAVRVTDEFGNVLAGVSVAFAVTSGGGSLTDAAISTDATGIARVGSWTLGTAAGANTLTATAAGIPTPVAFTATAVAGPSASITKQAGDEQTANVNSAVSTSPAVRVTDAFGNPVAGVTVTFAGTSGGGTVNGATATTNASGVATVGSWVLGPIAGTNTLTATVSGLAPATFTAMATSAADGASLSLTRAPVGAGLYRPQTLAIIGNPPGGVTVTLTSADPSRLLLGTSVSAVGSASIEIPPGASTTFYTHATEGASGSVAVTATAPGFPSFTAEYAILTPAIDIADLIATRSAVSADDPFIVRVGLPDVAQAGVAEQQGVRPGGSGIAVTVVSSNPAVAELVTSAGAAATVTVTIPPGFAYSPTVVAAGGVALRARGAGTVTVSATRDGLISTTNATRNVTLSTATITLSGATIGAGLQRVQTGTLSSSSHGGITVRITSQDPSRLLVAADANTPGSTFIDIAVANGTSSFSYVAQALDDQSGTVEVEATTATFAPATASFALVPPALDIVDLGTSATTAQADQVFRVRVGIAPAAGGGQTALAEEQRRRAGASTLTGTVSVSNSEVGTLISGGTPVATATLAIAPNSSSNTFAFRGLSAGTTTVTAQIPGFEATTNASRTITVSASTMTISSPTVGAGLVSSAVVRLGQPHGPVTVRVSSSDPNLVLVSPMGGTRTASFEVLAASSVNAIEFRVYGVAGSEGTAQITAVASGFTDAAGTVSVVQPVFKLSNVANTLTVGGPDDLFYVLIGIPTEDGSDVWSDPFTLQQVAGSNIPFTITSSDAAVARLILDSASGASVNGLILAGNSGNFTPRIAPVSAGTATITVSIPDFRAVPGGGSATVTVTPSSVSVSGATVGAGLQTTATATLNRTNHGGVTVRLTSADPAKLLLAPNATTAGTAFIDLPVANGASTVNFYVQALDDAAGSSVPVQASAPGFVDGGTGNMSIVQPAVDIFGLSSSMTTGCCQYFNAIIGVPTTSTIVETQQVRAGSSITATLTSSNDSVGRLIASAGSGGTVTVVIPGGRSATHSCGGNPSVPSNVSACTAAGGVVFEPLAPGTTTLSVTVPGGQPSPGSTREVTVRN